MHGDPETDADGQAHRRANLALVGRRLVLPVGFDDLELERHKTV